MARGLPWPESMKPIVDAIGEEAALRLVEEFGGTVIAMPRAPRANSPTSRVLGLDIAKKLALVWGWGHMTVPLCSAVKRALQHRAIVQDLDAGLSGAQIARKHNIHIRTVRRLKAHARKSRQHNKPGR